MVTVENVPGRGAKGHVECLRHIPGFGKQETGRNSEVAKIRLAMRVSRG